MTRSRAWYWDKANALAPAMPGAKVASVALLLAIAEHETGCGDAWPGENNWGATTRRGLSSADAAALKAANVYPVLQPTAARLASEAAATEALKAAGIDPSDAAIHVDSRPPGIVYFTWFAKFPSDVEGAAYFVSFFRTMAEKTALAAGSAPAEAAAMYAAHYYTGIHVDAAEDIADYLRAIAPLQAAAVKALTGWTPGAEPPVYTEPATPDLSTGAGLQQGLNRLGATPPLVEDGVVGPRTKAALVALQASHGLVADGVLGPRTLSALRVALG